MKLLITICARGGSKGIPGKNIRNLNGIPLIGYSINVANRFKEYFKGLVDVDIDLSTDSNDIKNVAESLGLKTSYTRPEILSNDTAGKLDAILELTKFNQEQKNISYDYVLDLDVSSPLRSLTDLINAFEIIQESNALNLFSVNKANKNPYFNMVEQDQNGFYSVCKKLEVSVLSRQTAPSVFELNASFYFFKKAFIEQGFKSVYSGKSTIYEMNHICFDLDHKIDFEFMEYLLENNKLDFDL
ncbi:MAG: acylneuraminate cytidylyltransferase family protein [Bacteroidia bacterium]|nr:acylneuraminate cytidylyltransferase family protein [Bacteroidia bacterium]